MNPPKLRIVEQRQQEHYNGTTSWVCNNYLIEDNGPGERLHHFPEEIVELG